jgi:tetratricopeptide (TPR) repeat protein
MDSEHDNLRSALEWGLMQADGGEQSLRLASALRWFWSLRGHVSEGRGWLDRALANPAAPRAGAARAKALYAVGSLTHWHGETMPARALVEESVGQWRTLGPVGQNGLAHALTILGIIVRRLGEPARARSLHGEAIMLFREHDDRWGLAYALCNLGLAIRDQDDFTLARSVIDESITLWQQLGDQWGLRLASSHLGEVALRQGDYEVARRHFADCLALARALGDEEAAAGALLNQGVATINLGARVQAKLLFEDCFNLFRELGNKTGIAATLYYFGYLAHFQGDNQAAETFFKQELELAHTTGPIWLRAEALFGLAGVAAAYGQALRAARLLGASYAQEEAAASYVDAADSIYEDHVRARAVAQLGEAAFAEAWAEGKAMTFEQAADYALETEPST